jgi:signal transduction histidine kinase
LLLDESLEHAQRATDEIRELAHGIMPAALTRGGLHGAVRELAVRMPMPVEIAICPDRFPSVVEARAYFVVAEALTNVAKHAHATTVAVAAHGSGLQGLMDRLAAIDGRLWIESGADGGTLVGAAIPIPTAAEA